MVSLFCIKNTEITADTACLQVLILHLSLTKVLNSGSQVEILCSCKYN